MKIQTVVAATLLLCGVMHAQAPGERTSDEKLLEIGPFAAKMQADNFIDLYLDDFRMHHRADSRASDLADKIEAGRKQQHKWETSTWSLSNSSLRPGESIDLEMGDGMVAVSGTVQTAISRGLPAPPSTTKPDEKIIYMVTAPPEIRSRILMEGLRHDLNDFAAILQFDGKSAERDTFWLSWKSAWFDAQEVLCKYNHGAEFTDLNGEKQTCETFSSFHNKIRD